MFRPALIALLLATPLPALAQSQLDRLEAISEDMNLGMAKMMAREIAAQGGDPTAMLAALPDNTWDDAFRAAGACTLDRYEALIGADGVETMLTKMEAMVPALETATMETMDALNPLPPGITEEQSADIARSCGMIELSMQRMQESGFTAAMMEAFQNAQSN